MTSPNPSPDLSPALNPDPTLAALAPAPHDPTRCRVCGFDGATTDVVADRGLMLIGECGRCGDRWTRAVQPAPARARRAPEVAAAA